MALRSSALRPETPARRPGVPRAFAGPPLGASAAPVYAARSSLSFAAASPFSPFPALPAFSFSLLLFLPRRAPSPSLGPSFSHLNARKVTTAGHVSRLPVQPLWWDAAGCHGSARVAIGAKAEARRSKRGGN